MFNTQLGLKMTQFKSLLCVDRIRTFLQNPKRPIKVKFNMGFTVEEKTEMVDLVRSHNYRRAAEIFNNRHPDRGTPITRRTVSFVYNSLLTRGTLERKKRASSDETILRKLQLQEEVIERFVENPHLSTRIAGAQIGTSHMSVWRVLKDLKFRPFKMAVHQKLHAGDQEKRVAFCKQLLDIFRTNPNFRETILWTDEKPFRVNDCFNRQNLRYVHIYSDNFS